MTRVEDCNSIDCETFQLVTGMPSLGDVRRFVSRCAIGGTFSECEPRLVLPPKGSRTSRLFRHPAFKKGSEWWQNSRRPGTKRRKTRWGASAQLSSCVIARASPRPLSNPPRTERSIEKERCVGGFYGEVGWKARKRRKGTKVERAMAHVNIARRAAAPATRLAAQVYAAAAAGSR
jgi:hypothetical protein